MGELAWLGAATLAARIRARELSPVEVVDVLRRRAERVNPGLNALVTPFDDAEDRARAAEAAVMSGAPLGALHGVPFTIKDLLDTAGVRTTRGSLLFADHVPDHSATAFTRLIAAGAIPLAKTNLPEFGLGWETDNLVFGRTVNPWNPERTVGGSSGGEAAAVAAGLAPIGVGSDLAGSIRQPAHYCGVVGLKPTHGRIPFTGHWGPDSLAPWAHVGPLARSVEDAALVLSVLEGPDGEDPYAHVLPAPPASPPRLRVGVLAEAGFGPIDEEIGRVVRSAGAALVQAGAEVADADGTELEPVDCNELTLRLYGTAAAPFFRRVIGDRVDDLHPTLRRRLLEREPATLDEYVAAEAEAAALRRVVHRLLRDADILLCPAAPVPAHEHGPAELVIGGRSLHPRTTMRATAPFNLTGSPAIVVPFGRSDEGLPIGVQLVGRHFEEEILFRAARALEDQRGPRPRPTL